MKTTDLMLDAEEQDILTAFENGQLHSIPNVEAEMQRTRFRRSCLAGRRILGSSQRRLFF